MGFRFRKSIKMGPVRVNLSKSGVGYSVGGKGLRVTKKAGGGTRTTASIPGTGISYSKDSAKKKTSSKATRSSSSEKSRSSGCLASSMWILGACLVVGLIIEYWVLFLAVALAAGAAYLAYRYFKNRKSKELPASEGTEQLPAPNQE